MCETVSVCQKGESLETMAESDNLLHRELSGLMLKKLIGELYFSNFVMQSGFITQKKEMQT